MIRSVIVLIESYQGGRAISVLKNYCKVVLPLNPFIYLTLKTNNPFFHIQFWVLFSFKGIHHALYWLNRHFTRNNLACVYRDNTKGFKSQQKWLAYSLLAHWVRLKHLRLWKEQFTKYPGITSSDWRYSLG